MKHIHPNTISWIAFLCAVFAGVNFWIGGFWGLLFAFFFIALNALFDALDGKIAKMTGKASKKGDFLDHVLDRYADIFIVGGIILSGVHNSVIGLVALVGILMTSYLGTQAMAVGAGRDYGGIMGRADRLVILMLFTLIQLIGSPFGFWMVGTSEYYLTWIDIAMVIIAIGGNITAVQRAVRAWKKIP
ncbi:MAG: CDP-alcohol phosphatidyltransferase family protein [Methanobacteriota archaeon]|nr:MAG: CDP-alcohol phosphatidyltransferase family protein [Euryarchaeota archaeon]